MGSECDQDLDCGRLPATLPLSDVQSGKAVKALPLLGAAALLLASLGVLSAVLYRNAANRDFISYWSSARLLLAHKNPYARKQILAMENAAGGKYREALVMRNPPWALFAVAPLGLFSPQVSACLWLVTLIVLALLAIKCLRLGTRPPPLVVWLFAPILGCAMAGQMSILLLAGIAFFFKYHQERPWLSGVALLMPALKPHLFLLLWPVILIECARRRNWKLLAAFGVGLTAAAVFPLLFDAHIWTHYVAAMRAEHIEERYLPNLSFLLRWMTPGHPLWMQAVPSLLGLALCARYYWRRRRIWNWRVDGAALLLVSTMVSPYSWPFDQLLMIPAIMHVCSVRPGRRWAPWLAVVNGVAVLLLLMTVPLSSPAYAWSATACLIWYVWARHKAGLSGVKEQPFAASS
jgi:Glycosyltransferase family 87